MCRPTSAQTASRTHWPSWSQAPSLCGSPKSPATIGPSTALDDLAERDLGRRPGQHVAAADAPFRPDQAGALQGKKDLLEVRLRRPVRSAMSRTEVGPTESSWRASDNNARLA